MKKTASPTTLQEKLRVFFVNLEILGSFESLDST